MGKIQHPGSISNEKCACDSFPSSLSFMLEGFRESTTSFVTLPSGFQDMEQVFGNDKYSVGDAGKRQRVSTSMECLLHSQTAEDHLGSNTSRGILGYMERLQPQKKNSECGRGGQGCPRSWKLFGFLSYLFLGFRMQFCKDLWIIEWALLCQLSSGHLALRRYTHCTTPSIFIHFLIEEYK